MRREDEREIKRRGLCDIQHDRYLHKSSLLLTFMVPRRLFADVCYDVVYGVVVW
jgi:hypothetical protein